MLTTEPPDTGRSCHKSATARGMLRRRCKHIALKLKKDPAALVAKIKIEINFVPPDPGRNRPKSPDPLRKVTIRTLPRDPPREGGGQE